MPYPKHIEQKLEFDQIVQLLHNKCISELGQKSIGKLSFVTRFDLLNKLLTQTREFKNLLQADSPFPSEHYYFLEPYLQRAALPGVFLLEDEWHQIRLTLQTFQKVCQYFESRTEQYPELFALFGGIRVNAGIIKHIERVIDENGKMRPNASPELAKISSSINDKEKEIRKRIMQISEKATSQGWLAETGVTVRDGRLVLPVLAEFKRNIPGFVHDESSTGQTVYIEPSDVFDTNNLLRELQIAYRREREKILRELTDKIRPDLHEINSYTDKLGLADFIRAKALLAIEMDADMPIMKQEPGVKWIDAYHPLLKMNHAKNGLKVIPLTASLTRQQRILVISGPNAGGKSVCLKTIGLLQYMLQCGLLIPCASHSECGVFKDIMVDIGDEQSIENDLSTYSSHLQHMKYFTDFADGKTLFLIDEFGTGTDPLFGGPLAESILNRLNQKMAYGVVTTHYSNLKQFASDTNGLGNASMLFDNVHMTPMYELEMGKPGSSYAFEIARKSGLPDTIIQYAQNKVGDKQRRLDDLLIELERDKKQMTEMKQKLSQKEAEVTKVKTEFDTLRDELEKQKKAIIQEAKKEALQIITEANSRIEQTIREIREKKAETETLKKVKSEIRQETETLKTGIRPEPVASSVSKSSAPITVGCRVKMEGQKEAGEVEELKKNKALVAFDGFRSWIDINRLTVVQGQKKESVKSSTKGLDLNDRMQQFSTELNIIGVRGEEALDKLQKYIDDAWTLGFKQVKIVHGKGYGILRKLVREYLKKSRLVESVSDDHISSGGDGVTIVMLRV